MRRSDRKELIDAGTNLWAQIDEGKPSLPANTQVYPDAFGLFPCSKGLDIQGIVQSRLYEEWSPIGTQQIYSILAAVGNKKSRILPKPCQALRLFDKITLWKPIDPEEIMQPSRELKLIGDVLLLAIVPTMAIEQRNEKRSQSLLELIDDQEVYRAIACLPYFIQSSTSAEHKNIIVQRIRRGIFGSSSDEVLASITAIEQLSNLNEKSQFCEQYFTLVDQIVSALETRKLPGLGSVVRCARNLVEKEIMPVEKQMRLDAALLTMFAEFAYDQVPWRAKWRLQLR